MTYSKLITTLTLTVGLADFALAQRMLLTSQDPPSIDLVDLQVGVLIQEDFLPSTAVGMQEPRDSAMVGGQIWISDQTGIYRFDASSLTLLDFQALSGIDQSRGIIGDSTGAWVAQTASLVRYDLGGNVVSTTPSPPSTTLVDVIELGGELLVSSLVGGESEVLRYSLSGTFLGVFASAATFPPPASSTSRGQLSVRPSTGTILLVDGIRIFELDTQGLLLQTINPSIFETAAVELPDGRFLIADALGLTLSEEDGTIFPGDRIEQFDSRFGAFSFFDAGAPEFSRFCPANTNSTGQATQISALGNTQTDSGELFLEGIFGPANEVSLVVYGAPGAPFGFGDGLLCLSPISPGIQRTNSLQAFDFQGQRKDSPLSYATDFAAGVPILAGSSWAFQLVYRDTASGAGAFNASDAILLTFE